MNTNEKNEKITDEKVPRENEGSAELTDDEAAEATGGIKNKKSASSKSVRKTTKMRCI